MADIEVIFDPVKEMATIVNLDTRAGWGPAMIGPDAGTILQAFVDSMPFDVTVLHDYQAVVAFTSFLDALGSGTATPAATAALSPLEQAGASRVDEDTLADLVAAASGPEPPDPQPADPDPEAAEGPPLTVVRCYNCNGAGKIEFGDGTEPARCNMCQGTGKLEMPVTA
jgi:hypothetical protein